MIAHTSLAAYHDTDRSCIRAAIHELPETAPCPITGKRVKWVAV